MRSCEFLRVIGLNFNEFQLCDNQAVIHIHSLMVRIPIFTETSPSMGRVSVAHSPFLGSPTLPENQWRSKETNGQQVKGLPQQMLPDGT